MDKVYLGIPTHDGRVSQGILNACLGTGRGLSALQIETGSSITCNFNSLYCRALNARKQMGITHFCMLHEDVWPQEKGWLAKMLGLMEDYEADILSVVIPLKKPGGITSTAIEIDDSYNVNNYNGFVAKKLTLSEIPAPTFTDPMILLNTGCMLVDLRQDWADKIWFEFKDQLGRAPDGTYFPVSLSEDYGMSRMGRRLGLKMFATTEIKVCHMGGGKWANFEEPVK